MGLLINATQNRPIAITGTGLTMSSVYGRLNFKAYPDGLTMEIGLDIYLSKVKYPEGITVFTDIPDGNFFVQIDTVLESQSIEHAHTYAIQYFENLGYQCQMI